MKEEQENSIFKRVLESIQTKRDRILSGKINCIPWGLPRFEEHNPGIEQGKYYLVTANSKVGKTQITDFLFLYNVAKHLIDNGLNVSAKIFYFTLEMNKEEKMLACFANILYEKEGIRISPTDLKSTRASKVLPQEILDILLEYEPYFKKIEEIVEFIDDIRHPTGIFNVVKKYALANGTVKTRKILIDGEEQTVADYYVPDNPEEYVMIIIDHVSLITPEKKDGIQMNLQDSIAMLSSRYLITLRNRFNYIPIVIQQQASAQESVENKKANKLKPSLDGLGDCKLTQRDANVIFGLFSPMRHEIPTFGGYDVTFFRDNIRFLEIIGGREGGAGNTAPLYFDGAVNYFKELPKPDDAMGMTQVESFVRTNRSK